MTIYQTDTEFMPAEVIERARAFFARQRSPYTAFPVQVGPNHLRLALEVGEVVIGAIPENGITRVRASSSRGAHLLTRFLATLSPARQVQRETNRLLPA